MTLPYDAILLVSFGGPERREDVIPFLENVLRGRNAPPQRMQEVAEHYYHFGGVSPLNAQCRELITALEHEMSRRSWRLPVYWGNRNWHPFLSDTIKRMKEDGVRRAVAIITSAFSSYSSCRQYLENIEMARSQVGSGAPEIRRIRPFFNHPGFVEAWVDRVREAWQKVPIHCRASCQVVFTAHSIPVSMAAGCQYQQQLLDVATVVATAVGLPSWSLAYQSRSGPPQQPWLEPDVSDYLSRRQAGGGLTHAVIVPLGFLTDHMEVIYDLDVELRDHCEQLGITMIRAVTVGTHPRFVAALVDLVEERLGLRQDRPTVGCSPVKPADCPADCCPRNAPESITPSAAPPSPAPGS